MQEGFPSEVTVRYAFRTLSLLLLLLLAVEAGSQSRRPAPAPMGESAQSRRLPQPLQEPPPRDPFEVERERAMARQRNKDRQAALKKDTDKLLELATQLKEYVDKTDENMLSLDVIKKAEEIEKLSKSVKEKMKADEYYPPAGSDLMNRR